MTRHGYRFLLSITLAGGSLACVGQSEDTEQQVVGALFGQPTTIGVFRSSTSRWLLRSSNTPGNPNFDFAFPTIGSPSTWVPVVGDWNGNITTTIGFYAPPFAVGNPSSVGKWTLRNSNSSGPADSTVFFGGAGDVPVAGDWDGNGTVTLGVYRPAHSPLNPSFAGFFLVRNSNSGPDIQSIGFGLEGDVPLVGDWDGNRATTIGLYRPSTNQWFLHNGLGFASSSPDPAMFVYGSNALGDKPVVGDWDGNATTTIGVFRSSTNEWYLRNSNTAGNPDIPVFAYGSTALGDRPVVGTWSIFVR